MKKMISRMIPGLLLSFAISVPVMAQTTANNIRYQSSQNQLISVYKGTIIVNGQRTFQFAEDNIVYKSKRNGLIEDKKNVFLVLEVTNGDKKNRLCVFSVIFSKADSLFSVVASDIKDFDHDGYLEFGGSEAPQVHPSADSAYYLPSKFYEVKKGLIGFDAEYTEKVDRKVNGTYMPDPSNADGKCCVAIPKKKR